MTFTAWFLGNFSNIPPQLALLTGLEAPDGQGTEFQAMCTAFGLQWAGTMQGLVGTKLWNDAISATPTNPQASIVICNAWLYKIAVSIGMAAETSNSSIVNGPWYKSRIKDAEIWRQRGTEMALEFRYIYQLFDSVFDQILQPYLPAKQPIIFAAPPLPQYTNTFRARYYGPPPPGYLP